VMDVRQDKDWSGLELQSKSQLSCVATLPEDFKPLPLVRCTPSYNYSFRANLLPFVDGGAVRHVFTGSL